MLRALLLSVLFHLVVLTAMGVRKTFAWHWGSAAAPDWIIVTPAPSLKLKGKKAYAQSRPGPALAVPLTTEIPPSGGGETLSLREVVSGGNAPPVYPEEARVNAWEGDVTLRLELTPEGQVNDVKVERPSSFSVLDLAAVEAARAWRMPSREISRTAMVTVQFRLR